MSHCPLHSGLHLPCPTADVCAATGLRIWPRSRATWKQGIAFNLNQFLDWGQHVKIRFKCVQRKRLMGQRQAAGLHPFSRSAASHWLDAAVKLWASSRSAVGSASDFTQKKTDHSFILWEFRQHISGLLSHIFLVDGDWKPKHILTADVPPPLFCTAKPLVLYKTKKSALILSCSEDRRVSESTLSISALKSFQIRMILAWDKLKQKEHWVWAIQRVAPLFVVLWPRQHQLWTLTVLWCNTN